MAKISLWNHGKRNADYRFIDQHASEWANASGTPLYIYKYRGTYGEDGEEQSVTTIQDILFQENRDRIYEENICEMRGLYNVSNDDADLREFGFFMTDQKFIEVHYNDMISTTGRRIMAGDVIELPHLRDEDSLDESQDAVNRFYVVEDASKSSEGFSSTWYHHFWRIKVAPITSGPEYADILEREQTDPFGLGTGNTLADNISTLCQDLDINDQVVKEAKEFVKARNFETRQFYFVDCPDESKLPWLWVGDGIPPNGAELIGSGTAFPEDAKDGDHFLKTNLSPNQLFRREGKIWKLIEIDYRMSKWDMTHRILGDFINNRNISTLDDGTQLEEKIALSRAVLPKNNI